MKTFKVGDRVRDLEDEGEYGNEYTIGEVTDVSDWPHHIVVRFPNPIGEMEWYRGCAEGNADNEDADFDDIEVIEAES